jgi:hypothetical protein
LQLKKLFTIQNCTAWGLFTKPNRCTDLQELHCSLCAGLCGWAPQLSRPGPTGFLQLRDSRPSHGPHLQVTNQQKSTFLSCVKLKGPNHHLKILLPFNSFYKTIIIFFHALEWWYL